MYIATDTMRRHPGLDHLREGLDLRRVGTRVAAVTPVCVSVLPVTCQPGKCLTVARTPASARPRANADAAGPTTCAVDPY